LNYILNCKTYFSQFSTLIIARLYLNFRLDHLERFDLISQIESSDFAFLLRECRSYSKASLLLITKLENRFVNQSSWRNSWTQLPSNYLQFSLLYRNLLFYTGDNFHREENTFPIPSPCDPTSTNPTRWSPYPDPPFLPLRSLSEILTESRRRP